MNHASVAGVSLVRNKRVSLFKLPSGSSKHPLCSITLSPGMVVAEQLILQPHFSLSHSRLSINKERPAGMRRENEREWSQVWISTQNWLFFLGDN